MKRCLYCNREKDESEFSEEHVIPQAIGGNLSPTNPFKTGDVCRQCNNVCGLFIDSAFIKNWFTAAGRSGEAMRYVRLSEDAIFPLTFMGLIPDLRHEDRDCEMWIGPTGDAIYHFHRPYPERPDMPTIVGPAPGQRDQVDPGFVFTYLVPTNSIWWVPILRSVADQFHGAALYLANGNTPDGGLYSGVPAELEGLKQRLDEMRGQTHAIRLTISLGYETRFLAKLALGIGHLFLNPVFSTSGSADILRSMMWERSFEARSEMRVHGAGVFGDHGASSDPSLSWPGGHVIALLPSKGRLALYFRIYDLQQAVIQVTDERAHWEGVVNEEGMVFAICPGLRRFVGPKTLPQFIAHRQGVRVDVDLSALEAEMRAVPPLPPAHLSEETGGS